MQKLTYGKLVYNALKKGTHTNYDGKGNIIANMKPNGDLATTGIGDYE